jgi:hypothetical protein
MSASLTDILTTQKNGVVAINGIINALQNLGGLGGAGVAAFSGGTTGLTPDVPTTGTVTLGGVVAPTAGGLGTNVAPTVAGSIPISTGSVYVPGTLAAGSGINISTGPGSVTISSTGTASASGVTSITAGTGLSANGTAGAAITSTGTLSITNTPVASGAYGGASSVPILTVNPQGQLEAAASVSISLDGGTY